MAHRRVPSLGAAALALVLPLLVACDGVQSTLEPDTEAARAIADLYWVMLVISVVVCAAVVGLLAYAVLRRRDFRGRRPPLPLTPASETEKRERMRKVEQGEESARTASDREVLEVELYTAESDRQALRWILLAAVVIPVFLLTGTFFYTLGVLRLTTRDLPPDLTVQVVGWQWWWEAQYLDAEGNLLFETANEIHLPAGKRVRFRLRSADVIHSFWVPQLAGKRDMIPGRTTYLTIETEQPGIYRGQCAEYCEEQHANMSFLVIVQPEEEFEEWAALQARDAAEPAEPLARLGREVFLTTACQACHSVRGTTAVGEIGPDLTHLASRRTLAALTIPNTKGHLGGWISNPQQIKPGANMPAVPLDSEALLALLHYLHTLR